MNTGKKMAGDELGYFIVAGVLRCTRSASKKLKLHHQTKQQMSRSPAGEDFGGDGDHITKQTHAQEGFGEAEICCAEPTRRGKKCWNRVYVMECEVCKLFLDCMPSYDRFVGYC